MKKIIMLMMMVLTIIVFGEKLTTDGKDNLDKLKGVWYSQSGYVRAINYRKGAWKVGIHGDPGEGDYIEDYEGSFSWYKLKKLKTGIFIYTDNDDKNYTEYYAYDVKRKKWYY